MVRVNGAFVRKNRRKCSQYYSTKLQLYIGELSTKCMFSICELHAVQGHKNLTTHKCGFIVHRRMGWLGASPDTFVSDPTSLLSSGIAKFKCPLTKKDVSLSMHVVIQVSAVKFRVVNSG